MLSVYLQGGLGNQLFQLFTLMSYSMDFNLPFKLKRRKNDMVSPGGSHRPTYWDNFLCNLSPYLDDDYIPEKRYTEPHFHFTQLPFLTEEVKVNLNMQLKGYFQSPKYFLHNLNKISHIIKLDEFKDKLYEKNKDLFKKDTISMHFRMGDFKKMTEHHTILRFSYYKKALKEIIKLTNKDDFLVLYCCEKEDEKKIDDYIRYIKKGFKRLKFKKMDLDMADWEQMLMMSLCNHNIIANSTFSWWGAFLNYNKDGNQKVIYPEKWFGDKLKHLNTNDLFPERWIKISE